VLENLTDHLSLSPSSHFYQAKTFLMNIYELSFAITGKSCCLFYFLLKFASFKEKYRSISTDLDIAKLWNLFYPGIIIDNMIAILEKDFKFDS
jgi:hypothetical protein